MKKLLLFILFIPLFANSQGVKIGGLKSAYNVSGSDYFIIETAGLTRKIAYNIFSWNADSTRYIIHDSLVNYVSRIELTDSLDVVRVSLSNKQASDATLTALAGLTITESSLIYGTGADAFSVLPKGTAAQVLKMNAGATAPEWVSGVGLPAGANREIQFNNNGVFGSDANFKWTGKRLDIKSSVGVGNTFIGDSSGRVTTGNYNTFLGFYSGYSNTTGASNMFLGLNSGRLNTAGVSNTFIGSNSGYSNSTGANNAFIGSYSGYSNSTGYNNAFIGSYSGYSNSTGYNNAFIGHYSGYSNLTGAQNTYLGFEAGYTCVGGNNTFIGTKSGRSTTSGNNNTFIGYNAGYYETGSNKLFIDNATRASEADGRVKALMYGIFDAVTTNQILNLNANLNVRHILKVDTINEFTAANGVWIDGLGIKDIGINFEVGATTRIFKDGSNNLSFTDAVLGTKTLTELYAGGAPAYGTTTQIPYMNATNNGFIYSDNFKWTGNTLFLRSNKGQYNLFIGEDVGISTTTGYDNLIIGNWAGYSLTTGIYNNFFGEETGYSNTDGNYNLFLGDQAGYSNISGTNNTYIGRSSGLSSTGSFNIFLGFAAGRHETESNKLFIDNQSRTNEATGRTNSLIYGIFDATPANQLLRINAKFQTLQFSGSLTDNVPTAAEIIAILGVATGNAGLKLTIRDTTGTLLLYQVESDGTDWYYTIMTKAL